MNLEACVEKVQFYDELVFKMRRENSYTTGHSFQLKKMIQFEKTVVF